MAEGLGDDPNVIFGILGILHHRLQGLLFQGIGLGFLDDMEIGIDLSFKRKSLQHRLAKRVNRPNTQTRRSIHQMCKQSAGTGTMLVIGGVNADALQ